MKKALFIPFAIGLAMTAAAPAFAVDNKTTGLFGGAAAGAVVGGPVGAVIGGAVGLTTGAAIDGNDRNRTVVIVEGRQPDVMFLPNSPYVVVRKP